VRSGPGRDGHCTGQIRANKGSWTDLAALTIRVDVRSETTINERFGASSPRKISCRSDDGYPAHGSPQRRTMHMFTRTLALGQREDRYAHQKIDLVKRGSGSYPSLPGPRLGALTVPKRSAVRSRATIVPPAGIASGYAPSNLGRPGSGCSQPVSSPLLPLAALRADLRPRLAMNRRAGGNGCAALLEWGRRCIRGRAGDIDFRQQRGRRGHRVRIRMAARLRTAGSAATTAGKDGHGRRQEQRREE
jgi:hypothetical protein